MQGRGSRSRSRHLVQFLEALYAHYYLEEERREERRGRGRTNAAVIRGRELFALMGSKGVTSKRANLSLSREKRTTPPNHLTETELHASWDTLPKDCDPFSLQGVQLSGFGSPAKPAC